MHTPMRRPGTPQEMAYACLYLGADESGYCNGSILVADGGGRERVDLDRHRQPDAAGDHDRGSR